MRYTLFMSIFPLLFICCCAHLFGANPEPTSFLDYFGSDTVTDANARGTNTVSTDTNGVESNTNMTTQSADQVPEHTLDTTITPTALLESTLVPTSTLIVTDSGLKKDTTKKKRTAAGENVKQAAGHIIDNTANLLSATTYLGSYLEPWRHGTQDETLEFLFENAELSAVVSYIEEKFGITFIMDDAIKPLQKGGKSIMGTKVSFKTHAPLSKKETWDIFVAFLDAVGVSPVPGPTASVYRLVPSKDPKSPYDATRYPLPTFIGVNPALIPDNDTMIRYVYFAGNMSLDNIINTVDTLKTPAAPAAIRFPELNAVIITDRASSIKAMIQIFTELDQTETHQGLAIIRLSRADAVRAAKIYEDFSKQETAQGMAARLLGSRKASTTEYFPRGTKVIAEPRTNSLIVLGTREALQIVTEFITEYIDRNDDRPDTPRYIYKLKFLDAENLATILNEALKFKEDSDVTKYGGVRNGDKYFKPITIIAEQTTNSLIINAEYYDDYAKLHALLQDLDIEQPQVVLRLFLVSIDISENKGFGVQMRNKIPGPNGLLGNNVNFQTSGLTEANTPIVERTTGTGATRLLGDLVNLANAAPVGSTIITLGSDLFGVWGVLNMLETYTKLNVVSNPFLVTTNKYPAQFVLGEIRRVTDATIFGQQDQDAFTDLAATLDIRITPQISKDGLITLNIAFSLEQFTDINVNSNNGNRTTRKIETTAIVGDNQVLALGGLIREEVDENTSRVPVLGQIPIIGWLFKNRTQSIIRTSLLLLIQAEIIEPRNKDIHSKQFTDEKIHNSQALAKENILTNGIGDPINRYFFQDSKPITEQFIETFDSKGNKYTQEALEERARAVAISLRSPYTKDHHPSEARTMKRNRRKKRNKIKESQPAISQYILDEMQQKERANRS